MAETRVLHRDDADIVYDVHGPMPPADRRPVLLMIAQPMDASGFRALAERFGDRTVVTYDPRGLGRSTRRDGRTDNTPGTQADDLHALVAELGAGMAGFLAMTSWPGEFTDEYFVRPTPSRRRTGCRATTTARATTPTARTAIATAEALGQRATVFPGHHGGFIGGEFGWPGRPDEFAARLREVLDATA